MTGDLRIAARLRGAAGAVVLVAIAFSQAPARVVPDTKLDLVVDPGRFLARAVQAWDPQAAFGQVQNQAYGYLFPMGPFFWLMHALAVPAWAAQRLWWSLLLVVAYAGFVRLARQLGLGTTDSRLLAGLAYALGPRVITELGSISVEALPLMVLPWVLLPLVVGSQGGSPRRAAGLSGLAVACLGGVNAAASLAVLVVPALYLLSRSPGPRRRRLAAWWAAAVALACAWWALPLLVLGRYGYPFLSSIETASLTTSVTWATNVLRGTDHWIGFLVGPLGPQWPAGFALAAHVLPAVGTVLVAGLGLAGVARSRTPERRFLCWTLLAGLVLVGAGYAGPAGAPASSLVQDLLDGVLAPFRNVHKFDPVLRLPLTLGLAVALARIPEVARRWVRLMRGSDGAWLRARPQIAPAAWLSLALVPLLLATSPAWSGRLAAPGSFTALPAWWSQTADWLAAQGADGRALLEPASRFGDYTWGRPGDEPVQALARSPWVVRDAVPLGAPGATRLLDGFEAQLAAGVGSPGLADALTRAGIRYVVLRNDLAPDAAATPPAVIRATLVASAGIALATSFGPLRSTAGRLRDVAGTLPERPAIEIFSVGDGPEARAQLLRQPVEGLSGGPEALSGAVDLDPGTPYVAVADGGPTNRLLVTDTLRKRERNVGVDEVVAYGPTQYAVTRGPPNRDVLPYNGIAHQTTARLVGAVSVTASSSAADPFARRYLGAADDAYAAVDGDPTTAWVADRGDREPQWRLDLADAVPMTGLVLDFAGLPPGVSAPQRVTVRTATGDWSGAVTGDEVTVPLPAGKSTWVTVRLTPGDPSAQLGLAEVRGLPTVARTVVVPADSAAAGPGSEWSFARAPGGRRACIDSGSGWACVPTATRGQALETSGAEPGPLDRTFTVGAQTQLALTATATPKQGPALDRLLDAATGVIVSGSSQLVDDAAARPGAAVDGDARTAWLPSTSDAAPALTLTYAQISSVRGLHVEAPPSTLARLAQVDVQSAAGTRTAALVAGDATFSPLEGQRFTVTFHLRPATDAADEPAFDEVQLLGAPAIVQAPVVAPCGTGPVITVERVSYQTSLTASVADVVGGAPLPLQVCGVHQASLAAGTQRLVAKSSAALVVATVGLAAGSATTDVAPQALTVDRWSPEHRVVELPPGGGMLVMDEGFNAGWVATVHGTTLHSVRVDGWRQAWVVPAGVTGTAVLVYRPGRLQRAGLVAGGFAALVLLGLVALPARRRAWAACEEIPPGPLRWVGPLVVGVVLVGVGGLLGWAVGRFLAARSAVYAVVVGSVALAVLVAVDVLAAIPPRWCLIAAQVLTVAVVVTATSGPSARRAVDGPGGAAEPREASTRRWPRRRSRRL